MPSKQKNNSENRFVKVRFFIFLFYFCCLTAFFPPVCATEISGGIRSESPEQNRILTSGVKNLYMVSPDIYRSAQPDEQDFQRLHKAGLKSVLNLRAHHSDKEKIGSLPLNLYELPMNAGSLTLEDLFKALVILRDAPRPLLIHCWHGSDRTGAVAAAYRIVFQNSSVESAVTEFMEPRYGHHRLIYRNIPKLLYGIDWEKVKQSLLKTRTDSCKISGHESVRK